MLGLAGNPITSLDEDAFDGMSALRELYLGGYNPPQSGTGRRQLTLSANQFADNAGLQALDLSNSRISTIPANTFKNLTQLRGLSLRDNDISTLTSAMFHADLNTNLQSLSLSCNNLNNKSFKSGWSQNLGGIRELYLHHNNLGKVNTRVVSRDTMPNLSTLSLEHNPRMFKIEKAAVKRYPHRVELFIYNTPAARIQFFNGPPRGWPGNVYVDTHSDVSQCGFEE